MSIFEGSRGVLAPLGSPGPPVEPLAGTGPGRPPEPLVLAVTARPSLVGRLAALSATAGVPFDSVTALRGGWPDPESVPLILADRDAVLPDRRRSGLVLLSETAPTGDLWQRAVQLGAEHVAELPREEPWVLDRILTVTELVSPAPVLGIIGGTGGAGASTLAVAVARAAAERKFSTLVVDTDPYGGGLDLYLGVEQEPGLRWGELLEARGRLQPGLVRNALPGADGLSVVSFDRPFSGRPQEPPGPAVEAVLRAGRREFELVVVDLGRQLGPPVVTAAEMCRTVVVLVPAQVRAAAAATGVVTRLEHLVPDRRLVVRGPAPTGLAADDISQALGLPILGELRTEPAVATGVDRGELFLRHRGSLAGVARRIVSQVVTG